MAKKLANLQGSAVQLGCRGCSAVPSQTSITPRFMGASSISSKGITQPPSKEQQKFEKRFVPAAWLRLPGLSVLSQRTNGLYGQWTYTFRTFRVVPDSSPIFEACKTGNLEELQYLIKTKRATIFDNSESGWSLLHVSTPDAT